MPTGQDTRAALHELVDRLPPEALEALLAVLVELVGEVTARQAPGDAPLMRLAVPGGWALLGADDEPLTAEDLAAIEEGLADWSAGRTIPHAQVIAELDSDEARS